MLRAALLVLLLWGTRQGWLGQTGGDAAAQREPQRHIFFPYVQPPAERAGVMPAVTWIEYNRSDREFLRSLRRRDRRYHTGPRADHGADIGLDKRDRNEDRHQ